VLSQSSNPLAWRVFADTCVVNRIVEFGEYLFDNYLGGEALAEYERRSPADQADIEALHDIVAVYQRACMPVYVTETVLKEVAEARRANLASYAWEVFDHWRNWGDPQLWERCSSPSFAREAHELAATLKALRDEADRLLVAEAIVMGCDVFLTVDRKSLWSRRDQIEPASVRILRPVELWAALYPRARIVC